MKFLSSNLNITTENEIITSISSGSGSGSLYISPRFVELHCHLREPGGEDKETLKTGIESAFSGGYGIICPMPNTKPVCDNKRTLKYILDNSKNPYNIEINPICAITKGLGGNVLTDFEELKKNGAIGFSDDGKPVENMEVFEQALAKAALSNSFIISHAENTKFPPDDSHSEWTAVKRELETLQKIGGRLHFAHISSKESVELIRKAKKGGLNVTAETAPHYFTFSKSDIVNNEARFKMNPPLRLKDDVEAVKEGLKDGTIDIIATDHAPHTNIEKQLAWDKAPYGITGFETAFALSYTSLVLGGVLTLEELINKLSYAPVKIINKNIDLKAGSRAEFNIIDLDKKWRVCGNKFKSKCKITPYEGLELTGKVVQTVIGDKIYKH